ncbi:hypothetical protein TGME49_252385 [Toxoplasma gondii ME49]|uniref:Uncharacterized protein n=6 Tax=Toxoplasma gondii TaxID=5811 RepID=A0A125YNJ3_TOXGV|nr:hypothetical protein TGME49_252385 [Toxoplasma gondii ME49]ESS30223.1 hypothetical protein TGVEG_252385 [Toxoplasma gondii VEG]KFG29695.1 hypothetical protein TGDOM2_252385 [Toxoplasma gondii GAB2-2007-GAL-DOM2]KFH06424.1 hypothetical protein TGVAND_252385 [Toxoplasma gondii VAND]KYF41810.1 hypothetical protein TGARI_252385 [Toxoplasma gondii ARI]RQX66711.1 hypothetical protein TGCAST_252385 [Toxoplasma gondii CAST]|eukprot:XP_018638207.1 hypothetical protein TGME49_252385 [Toxoplasma gondii ME49]
MSTVSTHSYNYARILPGCVFRARVCRLCLQVHPTAVRTNAVRHETSMQRVFPRRFAKAPTFQNFLWASLSSSISPVSRGSCPHFRLLAEASPSNVATGPGAVLRADDKPCAFVSTRTHHCV